MEQRLVSASVALSNAKFPQTPFMWISHLLPVLMVVASDFIDREVLETRKGGSFGIDRQLKVQVKYPDDATAEWIINN